MSSLEQEASASLMERKPHKSAKYWAWAFGGPVATILINMWGRLQYYAAHILLFPQLTISMIYLIYSTVDAFNDPIIGYIADQTTRFTKKYGKRFPWIMSGRILQPIFLILCFIPIVPIASGSGNLMLSITWFLVMMCIYETMGTACEINQDAMFPDLFRGQLERTKSIRAKQVVSIIFQIFITLFVPLVLGRLGGEDSQNAYLGTAIMCVIISYILLVPFTYGAYENKEMRAFRARLDSDRKSKANSSLKSTLITIFKDRNWMGFVLMFFLYSVAGICFLNGIAFFLYDGLGYDIDSLDAILPYIIFLVMTFIGSLLFLPLVKKQGARNCTILSLVLMCFFFIFLFLLPVSFLNILCIGGGISYGGIIVSGIYVNAETIDNAVIKSGKREEGSYMGILRVFTAYSYALQTFLFALVSMNTGFISSDPSTFTEQTYMGLLIQITLIPLGILLIGLILFVLMYKITKEDALNNSKKLKQLGL